MIVKIKRQDNRTSLPYFESFSYDKSIKKTVIGILEDLNFNDDLITIEGKKTRRISYDCSCMQKLCGACAMVVNGEPTLACEKIIDTSKTKELVITPLTKFPVICDLRVDRSVIHTIELDTNMMVNHLASIEKAEQKHLYDASKCLKCGLCLEVCPNYKMNSKSFFGALFANESYVVSTLNQDKEKLKENYKKYFFEGCSKAMSCAHICPIEMPTLASIAKMNQ